MEIRRMIAADIGTVAKIEEECFADPYSERSIGEILCDPYGMCFTALRDGEVTAYIIGRLIAPEGEIYRIATAPRYRRLGIAYRLLDYAVKTSRGCGLEALFLEVRAGNLPARGLYSSYGFTEVGIRRDYYKNPKEDAIIMLLSGKTDL